MRWVCGSDFIGVTYQAPLISYGHTYGLRRLHGEPLPLTAEEASGFSHT